MSPVIKVCRIIDLIRWGIDYFKEKGVENARREIEWFLCNAMGCDRIDLYLIYENYVEEHEFKKFHNMVTRRASDEPFQHIIGKAPFYGRDFIVNRNVLIPRPETDILIARLKENGAVSTLLDVGTGSGCIAITCSLEKLSNKIYATDISMDALIVANENMALYKTDKIMTICHDFLNKCFKTRFDVIISNPPYIGKDEMESLQTNVRAYDPKVALTDGSDGLVFYKRFANRFDKLLNPGGYMLLEIGGNAQKKSVEKIFLDSGLRATFYKDLQGDFRVAEVRK